MMKGLSTIMTLHKIDLVNVVANEANLSKKDANAAVDAMLASIKTSLENGEEVTLTGFGKFEVRGRAARKGRNPQTGEEIDIPATKVPAFKAGKLLREAVKK